MTRPAATVVWVVYPRCVRVKAFVIVPVLVLLSAAAACSAELSATDAYKVGCPAVDTVAGGGSVLGKATVAGLEKLSASGQLDPQPQEWVDATISVLKSGDPSTVSPGARKLIVDGCAEHGYPLRNLS